MIKVPRLVWHTVSTKLERGITAVRITPSLPQRCPGLGGFEKVVIFGLILCLLQKRWACTRGGL